MEDVTISAWVLAAIIGYIAGFISGVVLFVQLDRHIG
jgi:hypothetical protein